MDSENFNVKFGEVINTGAGTTDFNSLTNRPKYNNVKMTGNTNIPKVPTATSELTNDSGFITSTELGTETTAREQADNALQGQINTKADKSTTYTKTETDNLVNGAIGEVKVLTTEDYNWPADNPTGIAPWLLDLGWYTAEDDVKIFFNPTLSTTTNWHYGQSFYIGKGTGPGGTQYQMAKYMYRIGTYGVHPTEGYGAYTWITWFAKDNSGIQMVMFPSFADLSARVTRKAGAPTTSTEGVLGQLWEDSTGGDLYQLKSIDTSVTPNVYTWGQVGGSSVNVVQTTGTSTTDVISQNAVTLALADKQDTLTAGSNITISDNTISAIDTTYTAGTNVSISASNEISATDTTYSDFIGTDGTAAGTAGLVPAPATTDAGKFLKADGTWGDAAGSTYTAGDGIDITNAVISATNTGKARILTTADYNYPTDNPTGVGLWLLEPGTYTTDGALVVYKSIGNSFDSYFTTFIIGNRRNDEIPMIAFRRVASVGSPHIKYLCLQYDGSSSSTEINILDNYYIVNDLTSASTSKALSAAQGKVLKDLVDSLAIRGAGAPTTSTVGQVGTLYEDTTNGDLYICTDATNPYVWEEVGGGGSITPVQTTGQSTTDVMSQKATTDMVFSPTQSNAIAIGPSALYPKVGAAQQISIGFNSASGTGTNNMAIGSSARCTSGSESIAIGQQAYTEVRYSIALGKNAYAKGDSAVALGAYAKTHNTSNVAVGTNANPSTESGIYTVALGGRAQTGGNGSIALGAYSGNTSLAQGEMNIGSSNTDYGYNNTNYRLISGVYDGQSANDAVNLGQITPTTDSSAPTTATAGRLGEVRIDTSDTSAYMCVDTTGGTYTWKKITT